MFSSERCLQDESIVYAVFLKSCKVSFGFFHIFLATLDHVLPCDSD